MGSYDMDPIPSDDRQQYDLYLDELHAEVIASQGADPHAGCSVYAERMCDDCEIAYVDGLIAGGRDYARNVAIEDGSPRYRDHFMGKYPDLPSRYDGPIAGYTHGWSHASLMREMNMVPVPFVEFAPVSMRMGIA